MQKIPQNLQKRVVELINEFSKIAETRSIYKIVFLYISNIQSKVKLRNNTICNNIKKYKILRNKSDETHSIPRLQNIAQRN